MLPLTFFIVYIFRCACIILIEVLCLCALQHVHFYEDLCKCVMINIDLSHISVLQNIPWSHSNNT